MRKSIMIGLVAIFAALHTTLYFLPYAVWRNWAVLLEPIEGIILGPYVGFSAALLGSSLARILAFDPLWMFGMIAEPVSVLTVGLLSRCMWKPALAAYTTMLIAYFVHPYGSALPLWTILDVLAALILIYPAAKFGKHLFCAAFKRRSVAIALISLVGIATDSLIRIFLLIPCGLSVLFFTSFEQVSTVFIGGAVASYFEDLLVVAVSLIVAAPLIRSLFKQRLHTNLQTGLTRRIPSAATSFTRPETERLLNNVKS